MKKKSILAFIYNFLMSISSAVVGTLLLSYPLLALFILLEKTDVLVKQPLKIIMHNYGQLLKYLVSPFETKLSMSDFPTSTVAAKHFYDCKLLFQLVIIIFIIGIILKFYFRYFKKSKGYFFLNNTTALVMMILPFALIPFALTNFDSFFITFHHLLFNNNNWIFDPATDPIINVLSEGFFATCFAVAGIIYELYFAQFLIKK